MIKEKLSALTYSSVTNLTPIKLGHYELKYYKCDSRAKNQVQELCTPSIRVNSSY